MTNPIERLANSLQIPQNPLVDLPLRRTDVTRSVRLNVRGDQVFVAKKLNALLEKRRNSSEGDSELSGLSVPEIMERCWLPIEEAVRSWGVMPDGVKIVRVDGGAAYALHHEDLDCLLPGRYSDKQSVQRAAALLIQDKKIPGDGEIVYRDQAMTPIYRLDPVSFPSLPKILDNAPHARFGQIMLEQVQFREGFEPLDKPLFDWLLTKEIDFRCRIQGVRGYVRGRRALLEGLAICLPGWEKVSQVAPPKGLRPTETLFYRIGVLTLGEDTSTLSRLDAGYIALYSLLTGGAVNDAAVHAKSVHDYAQVLNKACYWAVRVMDRLEQDVLTLGEQGRQLQLHEVLRNAFNSGSTNFH